MSQLIVRGAPQEYIYRENCLNDLEKHLQNRKIKKICLLHGTKSWQAAQDYLPQPSTIDTVMHQYHGECSWNETERLLSQLHQTNVDAIVGVGSGKLLDLAKLTAYHAQIPCILIPTLASNCAAWTPICVIYTDDGAYERFDVLPQSASLVLIEPEIILHSPLSYFKAGIADTLAKWYEANVQLEQLSKLDVPLSICHFTAKQCKDILLHYSQQAVVDMKAKKKSFAWKQVVETIIMSAGMVGGFGDEYGRIVGAHAIHNGLTVIETTHTLLHGEKVAYGILIQLLLEGKENEVTQLLPFYQSLSFPSKLADLNIHPHDTNNIRAIAEKATVSSETIHFMPQKITANNVITAIKQLEQLNHRI